MADDFVPLQPPTTPPIPPPPSASPSGNGFLQRFLEDPNRTNGALVHAVGYWLQSVAVYVGVGVLVVVGIVIGVGALRRWMSQRWRGDGSGDRILEIELPPTINPDAASLLWTNLHDLLRPKWRRLFDGQPHLAFEYVWVGKLLVFRMWIPAAISMDVVKGALQATWPGAAVRVRDVEPIFGDGVQVEAGRLQLRAAGLLPIETRHSVDPLRYVFAAVSELHESDSALVQLVCKPLTAKDRDRRLGVGDRLQGTVRHVIHGLLDLATPGGRSPTPFAPQQSNRVEARQKASMLCWDVSIVYVVTQAPDSPLTHALARRADALASAFSVYTGLNRLARKRLRLPRRSIESRQIVRPSVLSVGELAALAHLPTDVVLPGATRSGAVSVSPGPAVSQVGKVIGKSQSGDRAIALRPEDACFHTHVMGSTGVGKSTLLASLVIDDVKTESGGVVVIDPKGDLVYDIVERLPRAALDRTWIIDPLNDGVSATLDVLCDESRKVATGFDEAAFVKGNAQRALVVENIAGIFRNVFSAYWGPRTDDAFRAACTTLMADARSGVGPSIEDVPRLLSDKKFRTAVLNRVVSSPGIGSFWDSYDAMSEVQQAQLTAPLLNKLRAFLTRDFVRDAVCPGRQRLDMADVLDGGILLVRIPKGVLGDETTRLLGSLVVAKVWQGALARSALTSETRTLASLYIDECQNFLNLPKSFDEMLAEARGYGLGLTLAHQHLGQLSAELRSGVGANARNKIWFSMSPEDGRQLERYMYPELSAHDLSNLGAYHFAGRLMANGLEARPFTGVTNVPLEPERQGMEALVNSLNNRREGGSHRGSAAGVSGRLLRESPRQSDRQSRRHSGGQLGRHS